MSISGTGSVQGATASQALALGALDAGVRFVAGYPGSPATGTLEALLRRVGEQLPVEWAINEKSAFDAAVGASLAGLRALVCLKSVGLNVALDSLMAANLAAGEGGLVLLVGDDPGAWGSQNEEDSRLLAAAAELPLLEPVSPEDCRFLMAYAFELAERVALPVVVRITHALAASRVGRLEAPARSPVPRPPCFPGDRGRYVVLPANVVERHRRLHVALEKARQEFEASPFNQQGGAGRRGVIAAGFAAHKLAQVLAAAGEPALPVLALGTLHPLPQDRMLGFLRELEAALVLEETAPFVEAAVQALAQRARLTLPILGRASRHLPKAGELSSLDMVPALGELLPGTAWPELEPPRRQMPSREELCSDCPYIPAFEALLAAMEGFGGREAFIITGEPGCMVRAQLPPWELLDVKYAMGSSIGLGAGLARAGTKRRVVALAGDSALLHSGLGELIDAWQWGVPLTVLVLANETTALSGGQPHPASSRALRGRAREPVDLERLIRAIGVAAVKVVGPCDQEAMQEALVQAMGSERLAVVIARGPCPRYV